MSLIKVCEIWTPSTDDNVLQLTSAFYGGLDDFRAASSDLTFAPGQGLPGSVWQSRLPDVLTSLSEGNFARAAAAREAGLTAGLGFPVVDGDAVTAVVVFLYGASSESNGVMEAWTHNQDSDALAWHAGFYGNLTTLAQQSKETTFTLGQGLPGQVWATKLPQLLSSLEAPSGFIRGNTGGKTGLSTGLGIPVLHGDTLAAVAVLLSSVIDPLMKIFEVWVPNADGSALQRQAGFYGGLDTLGGGDMFTRGEGLPGQVWATRAPVLYAPLDEESGFARYKAAQEAGLSVGIGIPILSGDKVAAVITLLD